jgi:quercetin dioxygenase-like cupin family protein
VPEVSENREYRFHADLRALVGEIMPDSIVSRTVHKDPWVKVTLFGFKAGQELSEHTASKPAIIEVIAGEALLGLGDDEYEARPGSWTFMEPGLRHSVTARTDLVMLLTLLEATPPRR